MKGIKEFKKNTLVKHITIISGILITIFIITNILLKIVTRHNQELVVPDFSNMHFNEAEVLATNQELRLDITDSVYLLKVERGYVIKQNPKAGSKVKKGRRILITINAINSKQVEMPSLTGYSLRQARTELASNGLILGKLLYKNDLATNNVLSQQYKGADINAGVMINSGATIDLVLGVNPNENSTFIPNSYGYNLDSTKDLLLDNSLNIGKINFDQTVKTPSDSLNAVVYQLNPSPYDSLSHSLGTYVGISLTLDKGKIPKPEDFIQENDSKIDIEQ